MQSKLMTVCSAGEVILMGKAQYLPVDLVAVEAALGVVLAQEAALLPQQAQQAQWIGPSNSGLLSGIKLPASPPTAVAMCM